MRTALITGAAGFIGSSLTERLLADGVAVLGVDSFEDYYSRGIKESNLKTALKNDGFSFFEGNILDIGSCISEDGRALVDALSGVDIVFHLAAQAGVRSSWGSEFRVYSDNNVLGTQCMLELACRHKIPRFVFASSSSVYGDSDVLPLVESATLRPISPYGVSKLTGEHLCRLYRDTFGVDTTSVRFFTVYGPRQRPDMAFNRFITRMLRGEEIVVLGDGLQTRDFTYIDDIVQGLLCIATSGSGIEAVNLGGGSRVVLRDVIESLAGLTETDSTISFGPPQAGDVRNTWADLSIAERLGYTPACRLQDGLAAEVDWLRGTLRAGVAE